MRAEVACLTADSRRPGGALEQWPVEALDLPGVQRRYCDGLLVRVAVVAAGVLIVDNRAATADDRPATWGIGVFDAVLLPLPADETSGHRDRTALGEVLGARVGARAERGDVDEQRGLVALIVDRQPQVADAAAVRQFPEYRVVVGWPTSVTVLTFGALLGISGPPCGFSRHDTSSRMSIERQLRPPSFLHSATASLARRSGLRRGVVNSPRWLDGGGC
jgi:hypothetical protein